MILVTMLNANWEKLTISNHINLGMFMLLFMICALEVILLKLTTADTSTAIVFERGDTGYDDDSSEYEEDIYYEDLRNNYEQWRRRRMRHRQQSQRQQQEMLSRFRSQQQQQQVISTC